MYFDHIFYFVYVDLLTRCYLCSVTFGLWRRSYGVPGVLTPIFWQWGSKCARTHHSLVWRTRSGKVVTIS